jgi:hypothetical protein
MDTVQEMLPEMEKNFEHWMLREDRSGNVHLLSCMQPTF